jgi:hypothetical protein
MLVELKQGILLLELHQGAPEDLPHLLQFLGGFLINWLNQGLHLMVLQHLEALLVVGGSFDEVVIEIDCHLLPLWANLVVVLEILLQHVGEVAQVVQLGEILVHRVELDDLIPLSGQCGLDTFGCISVNMYTVGQSCPCSR